MRDSLANNLNLMGTAFFTLKIRHKLSLINARLRAAPDRSREDPSINATNKSRRKIPGAWERVVSCHNHSELAYCNQLAQRAGVKLGSMPFPDAEPLVKDTGDRSFSAHMVIIKPTKLPYRKDDHCVCLDCRNIIANKKKVSPEPSRIMQKQSPNPDTDRLEEVSLLIHLD